MSQKLKKFKKIIQKQIFNLDCLDNKIQIVQTLIITI